MNFTCSSFACAAKNLLEELRPSRRYPRERELHFAFTAPSAKKIPLRRFDLYMCRRDRWSKTYDLFGIDRIEEWTYCPDSQDDQPCRRIYLHDHGDINMAPERPRSVGYDVPFEPRIIERKPESEVCEVSLRKKKGRSKKLTFGFKFRELFRPVRIERVQPKSILRRVEPVVVEPEYVELREPGRPRPSPLRPQRPDPVDFVPLPPPVPSPRRRPEEEVPVVEIRSPRSPRRPVIIHSLSPPLREHRRRRAPSTSPVREVETIRIRRFDNTDRERAERQRARDVEEEVRIERERRYDVEDVNRHLTEIAMHERSERRRAERDAENAAVQRASAEIAAADLQRENGRLDRERRVAEREAAVLALERERERERLGDALRRPPDGFRPARDIVRQPREAPRAPADRGAEVIRAAQEARRHRRGD